MAHQPQLVSRHATPRAAALFALPLIAFSFVPTSAEAVSRAVKMACYQDYMSHCSDHRVGSTALRQCMKAAGPKLSSRCVNALVKAGETKGPKRSRYTARSSRKSLRRR